MHYNITNPFASAELKYTNLCQHRGWPNLARFTTGKITKMCYNKKMSLLKNECIAVVLILFLTRFAVAQSVEAMLDSDVTSVGDPVTLVITASGNAQARLLDQVAVDGLQQMSTSTRSNFEMTFGSGFTKRHTTTLEIGLLPMRAGDFTIPALRVHMDGETYQTRPLSLRVVQGNTRRAQPVQPQNPHAQQPHQQVPQQGFTYPPEDSKALFGELVIPQESAFVGEIVPVELRYYIDRRYNAQFSERIAFTGEGFTVTRISRPEQSLREIDGITYTCITYRAAISPVKAGEIEIPSIPIPVRIHVAAQRSRSGFGGGIFDQLFQQMGITEARDIQIATEPVTLNVRPLPAQNVPETFDGAIGNFKISATAAPRRAAAGEPVTLTATVSGSGNFEAMGAPKLMDAEDNWRTYAPSQNFEPSPSDPIGFNGKTIYEFTMVARTVQTATPSVRFTYFDPKKEEYISIDTPPISITAVASADAAFMPTPLLQQAASSTTTPPLNTPPPADATPLPLPLAQASSFFSKLTPATFEPLWKHPLFARGGTGLFALLLVTLVVKAVRRHANSPAGAAARERRRVRTLLRTLPDAPDDKFLDQAVAFIEGHLAGRPLESLDSELSARLQKIIARHDSAHFAPTRPTPPDAVEREDIIETLQRLAKYSRS